MPFVVLQLCHNHLTGSIPTQLGSLKKLSVLALQSNQLTGAIPASLGDLDMLVRVDLSFNRLFGSIPQKLADGPVLEVLDIRNNTLSGSVPNGNCLCIQCFRVSLLLEVLLVSLIAFLKMLVLDSLFRSAKNDFIIAISGAVSLLRLSIYSIFAWKQLGI